MIIRLRLNINRLHEEISPLLDDTKPIATRALLCVLAPRIVFVSIYAAHNGQKLAFVNIMTRTVLAFARRFWGLRTFETRVRIKIK